MWSNVCLGGMLCGRAVYCVVGPRGTAVYCVLVCCTVWSVGDFSREGDNYFAGGRYLFRGREITRKRRLPATAKLSPGMGIGQDADESMMKV